MCLIGSNWKQEKIRAHIDCSISTPSSLYHNHINLAVNTGKHFFLAWDGLPHRIALHDTPIILMHAAEARMPIGGIDPAKAIPRTPRQPTLRLFLDESTHACFRR